MMYRSTNLFLEVEEIICLINQKELEGTATQVVPPKVNFPEFWELPLEVVGLSCTLALCRVINEIHGWCRHFQTTFDLLHNRYQFTIFLQDKLLVSSQFLIVEPKNSGSTDEF